VNSKVTVVQKHTRHSTDLEDCQSHRRPDALLREALEFLLAGDRQAPFFLLSRRTTLGSDGAIDLLMKIEEKVIAVVQRGSKILAERLEKDSDTDGQSEEETASLVVSNIGRNTVH
jgi:hypothetical protein